MFKIIMPTYFVYLSHYAAGGICPVRTALVFITMLIASSTCVLKHVN